MDGYLTDHSEKRTVDREEVEIVTYQGEHCDEYLVRDVKNGRCSLFYKGIVQLRWKEVNGVKIGGFTVYEKGKALRSEDWNQLGGKEYRRIENCKNGLELMIEGNGVVYRGGFDDVESMKREGRGMEIDEKSGRVLRCGMWKNDELFQIEKEYPNKEVNDSTCMLQRLAASGDEGRCCDCWTERDAYHQTRHRVRPGPEGR